MRCTAGRYRLADDEVIIEGVAQCLLEPVPGIRTQTYDYRAGATINGGQVKYEADGSWKVAVSARDPGMTNWLSTAGHPSGVLWFRWFLADEVPPRPRVEVKKLR
jgi:hypothetical protein